MDSFTEEDVNKVPFPDSWTAAQTSDHLRKVGYKTDEVLSAKSEPGNRQPYERASEFRAIFLNFDTKFKSPDFVAPELKTYDKQRLIDSLLKLKDEIIKAAYTADLTETAPLPDEHPLQGITKLELLYFLTYHTQRHNQQIEKIKQTL